MNSQVKDLAGEETGHWTVISEGGRASNNEVMWKCQCVCGTIRYIRGSKIRQGKSKSCGCITSKSNITGKKFGEWEVISRTRDHNNESKWLCSNGNMIAMMSTSQVTKGRMIVGDEVRKWNRIGSTGTVMGNGDSEWIVGSSCPKPQMILAECPETGIIAVFDESDFGNGKFPTLTKKKKPLGESLVGQQFRSWKVEERAENNSYGQVMWKCQCQKCKVIKDIASFYLKRGAGCGNCREVYGTDVTQKAQKTQKN